MRRTHATTAVPLLVIFALACAALAAPAPEKRSAAHNGVSLTYDSSLAREVRAETAPAAPLEDAGEKPDGVYPEHVAFTLVGLSGAPANSYHEPVVRVSPVAEYLKAFSVSPRYVREAERTLSELRRLIRRRPAALKGNVPMLPFPDATEVFHARVKYLRFRGGSGVAFLTQAQQDYELINGQHASYSFRGLTDDGRYYVTADLPVGAPVIAATRGAGTHEGYMLPREVGGRRARQRYSAYVERVRGKLERLSPAQFGPDLRLYDELLSSLHVGGGGDRPGAAGGSEQRVRFRRGQTKARVSGRLAGPRDAALFVAHARSGQHMRVTVVRSSGPVRCVVSSPSGGEEGQPGVGTVYDGELTETGPYRVRVTESPMGEPWRGSFLLEIEIK